MEINEDLNKLVKKLQDRITSHEENTTKLFKQLIKVEKENRRINLRGEGVNTLCLVLLKDYSERVGELIGVSSDTISSAVQSEYMKEIEKL